jgi:hypothetical protein
MFRVREYSYGVNKTSISFNAMEVNEMRVNVSK